jgi:hypothetical protein
MKTYEIHYEITFSESSEVEANSLKEAIESFDMDEAMCEAELDPTSGDMKVVTEECKEVLPHCSLCFSDFTGHGNDSRPLSGGRCCDNCNATLVIPARIKLLAEPNQDIF